MAKDYLVVRIPDERQVLFDAYFFTASVNVNINERKVRIVSGWVVLKVLRRIVGNNVRANLPFDLLKHLCNGCARQLQPRHRDERGEFLIEGERLAAWVYFWHGFAGSLLKKPKLILNP